MRVSKNMIVTGAYKFIHDDVITGIPDAPVRTIVGAFAAAVKRNPDLIDRYLAKVPSEDGMYDLGLVADSLAESIREYGNLTITIPAVPLLMPSEKVLSFSSSDVEMIKNYIEAS